MKTEFSLDNKIDFDYVVYTGKLDELLKDTSNNLDYIYLHGNQVKLSSKEFNAGVKAHGWFTRTANGRMAKIWEASRIWDQDAEIIWLQSTHTIPLSETASNAIPFRPVYTIASKIYHSKLKAKLITDYPFIQLGGPTATWERQSPGETMESALYAADAFLKKVF